MVSARMTPEEFENLAKMVFGNGWKKPLSRELGCSPRMIRFYVSGHTEIPQRVADQLRGLANLGTAGEVVKAAVVRYAPKIKPLQAHTIALEASREMERAGLLKKR